MVRGMSYDLDQIKTGTVLETQEQVFSERNLILGILWEGDAQLHTNKPGMEKTPFGTTIVHGNSVTSMVVGQLFRQHFGEADKIAVSEINVSYVGAVHVGDSIKGIFHVEECNKHSNSSGTLTMTFEVVKNRQNVVTKGKTTIEIEGKK
jgi:acyl dehydratase